MDHTPLQSGVQHHEAFSPEDPAFAPEDLEPRPFKAPPRHRVLWTLAVLVLLLLLAVLPPLVSVNRYQREIVNSISLSLGRPVRAGEITLNLLPFPGFTIKEFNVSDDPAFSSEPVIHAGSVMARLRWRSLWRRRIEFSRITLTDSSVNLVRRPTDGQWNLESILLQASRMPAAPTAQRGPSGDRPRFPYIEASGARLNLKMGLEKLPVSLTEADFALWLPEPNQYRIRLEAHPSRTDSSVTDTGVIRLEGTLARAASLAEVPIDLHASWTAAPLGAASAVLSGRDLGFRGELNLNTTLRGTVGNHALETRLQLDRVRRADFVPARLLDADISCTARALGNLRRLQDLHCTWPAGSPGTGLVVTGEVPDTLTPATANLQAELKTFPAGSLLDILHLASARVSPALTLTGTLDAHATCCTPGQLLTGGTFTLSNATLADGTTPPYLSNAEITGQLLVGQGREPAESAKNVPTNDATVRLDSSNGVLSIPAFPLDLGATKPATLAIEITPSGYSFHLAGPVHPDRLQSLAQSLPPFGDGLPEAALSTPSPATPTQQDLPLLLLSHREGWHGPQTWSSPQALPPAPPTHKHKR